MSDKKEFSTIYITVEQHFFEYEGHIYTDIAFAYPYWQEYLKVFDRVCPIGRVKKVASLPDGCSRADGPNVCFVVITDYMGFWDFLKKMPVVLFDCYKATRAKQCYLLKGGGVGTFCWLFLRLRCWPYAVELVGHASDSVVVVRNVQIFGLHRLLGYLSHKICSIKAKRGVCANYVSRYLQKLYPTNSHNEWVISDVKVDDYITSPRRSEQFQFKPFRIVNVGRLEPEKGQIYLIKAAKRLLDKGLEIQVNLIGPGKDLENLRAYVEELGISGYVKVCGMIELRELLAKLDNSDLFILPSLTEGMPRALIEAMSRGLPAIGSNTKGINELLDEEYLFPVGNDNKLAEKISELIGDSKRLAAMSRANFTKAMEYKVEIAEERKLELWNYIKGHCFSE